MTIWDQWSTVKKTRAMIALIVLACLFLYGAIGDAMGW
jgi:hypothetical protein